MDIKSADANKFIALHAHPAGLSGDDVDLIADWLEKFPYCQSLRLLAAHSSKDTPNYSEKLATAAAFASSRTALFQLIHHSDTFETDAFVIEEDVINVEPQTAEADIKEHSETELDSDEVNEVIAQKETQEFTASEEIVPIDESSEKVEEEETSETVEEEILGESPIEAVSENDFEQANLTETEELETLELSQQEVADEILVDEEELTEGDSELLEDELNEEDSEALSLPLEEEDVVEADLTEEPAPAERIEDIRQEEKLESFEDEAIETIEESSDEVVSSKEDLTVSDDFEGSEDVEVPIKLPIEEFQEEAQDLTKDEVIAEENQQHVEQIAQVAPIETISEQSAPNVEMAPQEFQEEELSANQDQETVAEDAELEESEAAIGDHSAGNQPLTETELTTQTENKDELIFDSPVASDFFAFAKAEKPEKVEEVEKAKSPKKETEPVHSGKEQIASYNDERMPYTFLWWLNKTRQEHASNNQPYVKAPRATPAKTGSIAGDALNHQIAENIFHLRGVEEIEASGTQNFTVPFDFRKKEFQIIEKFIKEEPQIKPPAANKIDSENKAKRSSEDANQVVSETLAKIYVEQMLYHKALDVYKKLSLKYPEKSTYFASQIKYLELKVN